MDVQAAAEIHHGASSGNALNMMLSAFLLSSICFRPPVDPAFFDAILAQLDNCILSVFSFQPDNCTIDF